MRCRPGQHSHKRKFFKNQYVRPNRRAFDDCNRRQPSVLWPYHSRRTTATLCVKGATAPLFSPAFSGGLIEAEAYRALATSV